MRKTILITEAQQRVILCELANKEIDSTIGDNDKLVKRIAKQASEQIKFDLSILATFSMSIGGLMGPLENFIRGEYPEMSTRAISLLLGGIGFQYMMDNKEPLSKLIQKIKEDGLYDIYKKVLKKSEVLKDSSIIKNVLDYSDSIPINFKGTQNKIKNEKSKEILKKKNNKLVKYYLVKKKDTIDKILLKNNISLKRLISLNPKINPKKKPKTGMKIRIK